MLDKRPHHCWMLSCVYVLLESQRRSWVYALAISFPKVITINKSVFFYLKIDLDPLIDLFMCIPVSVYVCVVCNLLVGTHNLW